MATLYFKDTQITPDFDWGTLIIWWTDETYTTNASNLPSSTDNIIIDSHLDILGSSRTVVNGSGFLGMI